MTTARARRRLAGPAACCVAALLVALPAAADTVTKTWSFATAAEGFTATTGGQSTAAYDGGTGNPPGSIYTEISGRNKSNPNYWEWTGTFEDMGVPTGGTVSAIQLTGGVTRCTVYTNGSTSTDSPWELWDSTSTVR